MYRRVLFLIFVSAFLKELVWVALVPLWHFPDEQSHVGQVAFLAETGRVSGYGEYDLTEEIRKSEELLGTERDELGINKFTYHPEYKIDYIAGETGKYEEIIDRLSQIPASRRMVKQEASHYPNMYYAWLGTVYRLFYSESLIFRVFALRIVQIIFFLGTVYLTWRIAQRIFPEDSLLRMTLPLLVSFHPMFSFVSAGVNSDNIGNFMFTFYMFIALYTFQKMTGKSCILLTMTSFLTSYFKPQFIIVIPLTMMLIVLYVLHLVRTAHKKETLYVSLSVFFFFVILLPVAISLGPNVQMRSFFAHIDIGSILSHFIQYALPHSYREVLPWFWGIYDWLGVTYPRPIHRTINYMMVLSLVGYILWIVKPGKKSSFTGILFMAVCMGTLYIGIYLYDWLSVTNSGIHLGVQGRYLFPVIVPCMLILLIGWNNLMPIRQFTHLWLKIPAIGMVLLNIYALWLIVKTYYDSSSYMIFIHQASQYKPWYLKGGFLTLLMLLYGISLALLLLEYIRYGKHHQKA